jgi:hypothetical protein
LAASACRASAACTYQSSKDLSAKGRMECMTNGSDYESQLWHVLAKEHLVDLSQFHKNDFFDEIPLFSRDSDIGFLSAYPTQGVNNILLRFALKFLKSVVSYEEHRTQYFAAITVWSPLEGDPLVPNLFVWSGPARALRSKLLLEAPTTSFARRIKQLVSQLHARNGFEVLQDTRTDTSDVRVFISLSRPPYKTFVSLQDLQKQKSLK